MKKKFVMKRTLACLLATSMIFAESLTSFAATDVSGKDVVITQEPGVEVLGEEEPVAEVPGEETPSEDVSAGDEATDVSGGDVSDGDDTGSEEPGVELPGEEVAEMFPGMGDAFELTTDQLEEKQVVKDYAYDWGSAACQSNYKEDELVFLTDSEEEALAYAKAYNATLDSFSYGVAVIKLNADPAYETATVYDAMCAAASLDNNLPAVWPNYIQYLDSALEEGEFTGEELNADPFLSSTSSYNQWYHSVVNSQIAYDAGYRGKGVTVAVIDAGANLSHEDLNGIKGITVNTKIGTTPYGNHGANVAGIIGAKANSFGGRGIAPECNLISLCVFGDKGTAASSDSMRAIEVAIENKANIINMSLGSIGYNAAYDAKITQAYDAGIAVFCSSGNSFADSIQYPSGYAKANSVAALGYSLGKTEFSNYDKKVRYSAPGYNIWSCYNSKDTNSNSFKRTTDSTKIDFYGKMDGTSQATPIIAGCAAVLWNQVPGTGRTKVDNLLALMDKSCVKVEGSGMGKGYVDLAKALGLSNKVSAPNKPVFKTKAGTYNAETVDVTITAEAGCQIYYSTDGKAITYKNGVLSDNAKAYTGKITVGNAASVTVHAIAVKNSNKLASADVSAKYTFKPNVRALTLAAKGGVNKVAPGGKLSLTTTFTPAFAPNKKVKWRVTPEGKGVTVSATGVVSVAKTATVGSYTIQATSEDNPKVIGTISISVQAPTNPVTSITTKTKNVTILPGQSFNITDFKVTFKDGTTAGAGTTALKWKIEDSTVASYIAKTTGLGITGQKAGKTQISAYANDGSGKSIVINVTVTQPVEGLTLNGSNVLSKGKSITLTPVMSVKPTNGKLVWSISPEGKGVKVSNGKVSATAAAELGDYTITAKATDGSNLVASKVVTVVDTQTTNLSVNKKAVEIFRVTNAYKASTSATIYVTCNTKNWQATSSNDKLVKVSTNAAKTYLVVSATGNATGTATITVATTDGSNKKATIKVTVKNPATKIYIAPTKGRSEYLAYGTSMKMGVYMVTDSGKVEASAKKFTWKSSNPSVIKVDANGTVTGRATGFYTATITATATDGSGVSASYVLGTCDKVKRVFLSKYGTVPYYTTKLELPDTWEGSAYIGAYSQNKGTVSGSYTVKSSSTDLAVAIKYVNSKPVLTFKAKKAGTYKVTISCIDGSTAKAVYTIKTP